MKKRPLRREFSVEFRLDAVKRVEGGEIFTRVARDLDISASVLRRWVTWKEQGRFDEELALMKGKVPATDTQEVLPPQSADSLIQESLDLVASDSAKPRRGRPVGGPYRRVPDDVRQEAIAKLMAGDGSVDDIAKEYGVAPSTVRNWRKKAPKPERPLRRQIPPASHTATGPDGATWQVRQLPSGAEATIQELRRKLAAAERFIGKLTLEMQMSLPENAR